MPPLRGIDRGLNGEALKALEESGHGQMIAVVDSSYPIPREAQVIDYRGPSSAAALEGVLRLVPVEPGPLYMMMPDSDDSRAIAKEAQGHTGAAIGRVARELDERELWMLQLTAVARLDTDSQPGFYSIVDKADTLFIRTIDDLPYACAAFVIGHSQRSE